MAWIKPTRLLRAPDSRVTELNEHRGTLEIQGLFCGICASRVSTSLNNLDGVQSVSCDLETAQAVVQFSSPVDEAALRQAVLDAAIAQPLRRATERAARAVGL